MLLLKLDPPASHFFYQFRASTGAQQSTFVERIDKNVTAFRLVFRNEVKGQAHAFDGESDSPGDDYVDDGQGDGYSNPAIDDFIEKAVAGIVVALAVAAKTETIKQSRVQS